MPDVKTALIGMILMTLYACGGGGGSGPRERGLIFPFQNPGAVESSYCFGLQPWDTAGMNEIHGGIDLTVPSNANGSEIARYPVVAPEDSVVAKIILGSSGHGLSTIPVVLKMNDRWYTICNFEPQTVTESVFTQQTAAISVREGDPLRRGELIGELLVKDVKEGAYPHLHFALLYLAPGDTLENVAANVLSVPRSDGKNLPPPSGPGSPWEPRDLGIPSTFFCPYEYSTPEARAIYDALPHRAANGDACLCVCAYGSTNGDCGVCPSP